MKALDGFLDLAGRRHSVRAYETRPVEREKIERCLEAARLAPSACNSQPWMFVVVEDPALKKRVAEATSGGVLPLNHFTRQAPVLVVVVAQQANVSARAGAKLKDLPFPFMDCAIAAEHFCLQAAEEGLGTCMLGWFDASRVRELLGIPASARPALILTLGYSAEEAVPPRRRKLLPEMSAWNRYPGAVADTGAAVRGWRALAGWCAWLLITYAAAAVGGAATARAGAFYAELAQPQWAPPGWVFGPVWSLLYTLMAVAAWRVWCVRGFRGARAALGLYVGQLAVNALWSWLFFAWRLGGIAFAEILVLAGMVLGLINRFRRVSPAAAWLLVPYLAWLVFAAALALAMWRLNPGLL